MKTNKFISVSAGVFLILTLLVLSVPEKAYSGVPFSLGCCVAENGTSQCVGCGENEDGCAIPQMSCLVDMGGTFFAGGSYCEQGPSGASCFTGGESTGCCVTGPGACEDDLVVSSCGGEQWFVGASCAELPICEASANVPTLSQWGLITMVALLGIVGFIILRRRKAEA